MEHDFSPKSHPISVLIVYMLGSYLKFDQRLEWLTTTNDLHTTDRHGFPIQTFISAPQVQYW